MKNLLKMLVTAAAAAVATVAGFSFAAKHTHDRLVKENNALPIEDRLSDDELNDAVLPETVESIKSSKVTEVLNSVMSQFQGTWSIISKYRTKAAIIIIALSVFEIPFITAIVVRSAYVSLFQTFLGNAVIATLLKDNPYVKKFGMGSADSSDLD